VSRRSGIPRLQEEILTVLRVSTSTPAQLVSRLGCKKTSFHVAVSELERRGTITATGHGPNRVLCFPTLFTGLDLRSELEVARDERDQALGLVRELQLDLEELKEAWPGLEDAQDTMGWPAGAYDCDDLGVAMMLNPYIEDWCGDCEVCDG
jgi:hypothetical protein